MFSITLKKTFRIIIFLIKWLCFLFILLFLISIIYDFLSMGKYTIQIVFYIALIITILIYTYLVFFKTKILNIIITIGLWLMFVLSSRILPDVTAMYDNLTCIDTSVCKEGIIFQTDKNVFIINEENCNKFNYFWDKKNRTCNLRKNNTLIIKNE